MNAKSLDNTSKFPKEACACGFWPCRHYPFEPDNTAVDELMEKLAAIEHERWADWQRYLHSKLVSQTGAPFPYKDGMLMLPSDYQHWEEQIAADYSELSDAEKASDMEQVDRYWSLIQAHINTILSEIADELEGQRKKPTTFDGDTPATTLGDTGFNEALDTAIQIVKERL